MEENIMTALAVLFALSSLIICYFLFPKEFIWFYRVYAFCCVLAMIIVAIISYC